MLQQRSLLSRRRFLAGTSAIGIAGAIAAIEGRQWLASPAFGTERQPDVIPFFGAHQAGVTAPETAAALLVAVDVTARTNAELVQLFQTLTHRIQHLMAGGTYTSQAPKFPPIGSGILGETFPADRLTVTVGVGASLFDDRFGLAAMRPRHLTAMPWFPNDRLDANLCHGDLLLQFCANHAETNIHALRDLLKYLSGLVVLRWQMTGFQQPNKVKQTNRTSVRNLLGFKDGTANLDPNDDRLMKRLVWVQPNSNEPAWAVGGTYQVVRIIRMFVEFWDRAPLEEQEEIIGRAKESGAPLGYAREDDIPSYARGAKGAKIPLDAHIRLANPRTAATDASRILRRGFHYSRSVDTAGQLDMGLMFIAFQQDVERGFATIQARLNGEPLEEYIKPIGGGYFFTLPGVKTKDGYLGQALLE